MVPQQLNHGCWNMGSSKIEKCICDTHMHTHTWWGERRIKRDRDRERKECYVWKYKHHQLARNNKNASRNKLVKFP